MSNQNYSENIPNAAKLIDSLRHLDYTNESAILDIIDNSIDARATQIWLEILSTQSKSKEPNLIKVMDNGSGMDHEGLNEAMRLGSDTPKNPECDLGLYGMGLITASISMGKRLEVITRNGDGICLKAVQDLDVIKEQNQFVKILEQSDQKTVEYFEKHVLGYQKKYPLKDHKGENLPISPHGTIILISNIDNCKWKTIKGLADTMIAKIGQTHRKFLQAGTNFIYVNGEEVKPIDPINDFEPTILHEEEMKLKDGDISIKLAILKDYGDQHNRQQKINITNQGFYVIRNNREIMTGVDFGIWTKHNSLNRFRSELSYPGTLDKVLSCNFSKSNIDLNQSLQDKLSRICSPYLAQIRQQERRKNIEETKEDFTDVEKYITRKTHLLTTPKTEIEKRSPRIEKNILKTPKSTEEHEPRLNITKRKRISLDSRKVRFEKRSGDEKGPLYDAELERDVVVVFWNVSHPFYLDVIAANSDNPDVFNPLACLIYSFANAELRSGIESDTREIIENIRYDVGRNLAVLMH